MNWPPQCPELNLTENLQDVLESTLQSGSTLSSWPKMNATLGKTVQENITACDLFFGQAMYFIIHTAIQKFEFGKSSIKSLMYTNATFI